MSIASTPIRTAAISTVLSITIAAQNSYPLDTSLSGILTAGLKTPCDAGDRMRVAYKVGRGYAAHLILKQEQAQRVDLIALGKQRRSTVEEFLLGRVTRHVLADSQSDVLVVPA